MPEDLPEVMIEEMKEEKHRVTKSCYGPLEEMKVSQIEADKQFHKSLIESFKQQRLSELAASQVISDHAPEKD